MLNLGVNVDHVATVRQARLSLYPDPVEAALAAQKGGAWGITAHLREDRRHIHDQDLLRLSQSVKFLNMEMAVTDEMIKIACQIRPHSCCLVPEKRQELTTEGGLDVKGQQEKIKEAIKQLHGQGIIVSLFIDPELEQLDAAHKVNSDYVELHTGKLANLAPYTDVFSESAQQEIQRLCEAAKYAHQAGLKVNAGHGIDYQNIKGVLQIPYLCELNIGHSIVGRAITVGMETAVREMTCCLSHYSF